VTRPWTTKIGVVKCHKLRQFPTFPIHIYSHFNHIKSNDKIAPSRSLILFCWWRERTDQSESAACPPHPLSHTIEMAFGV
jgi:hypothetical protein